MGPSLQSQDSLTAIYEQCLQSSLASEVNIQEGTPPMPNDSKFYMRLPSALLQRIRLSAAARGVSISDFMRDAAERSVAMRNTSADDTAEDDPDTAE
jgi:predicted DNA binding CopG/RHH family protein